MKINTELILENPERDFHSLRIMPDFNSQNVHLVCLQIKHINEDISLCNNETIDDCKNLFHLDKFQIGCLIDYLNKLYSSM